MPDPGQASSSRRINTTPTLSLSKLGPPVPNTPRRVKLNAGDRLQHNIRTDIMKEMADEMHECPLKAFLENYAPFRPSQKTIDAALQHYIKKTDMLEEGQDGFAWADFAPSPSSAGLGEDVTFARLKHIVDELRHLECIGEGACSRVREAQFHYKSCPTQDMASEIMGTGFRVDACITSEPTSDVTVLADTAVTLEFKRFGKDTYQNYGQLISGASQIMNDDPRRMWTYGITIEDTMMSVWYFCRSHSVKSVAFDFTTDIKSFIRVFMSFLYATPKEIGYDPTVHRVLYNEEFHYIYELETNEGTKCFRTLEPLFNSRVLCISGRKTRVWRAIEVRGLEDLDAKDGVSEVALKDVWLDRGLATEKEIQDKIFDALGRVEEPDYSWAPDILKAQLKQVFEHQRYRDCFMEIKYDMVLSYTKNLSDYATRAPNLLHPIDPTTTSGRVIEGANQIGISAGMIGSSTSPHTNPKLHRQYRDKKHYRLVYGEVGHSLDKVVDLEGSFVAIRDVFIALVLMYLVKWLHRDFSPGNIILVGEGSNIRGKLSDLEYAREFNATAGAGDPKTGTPFFMAIEIHNSFPLSFRRQEPPSVPPPPNPFDKPQPLHMVPEMPHITKKTPTADGPGIQFRFQHDLESLWWIVLWILLCRIRNPDTSEFTESIFTPSSTPTHQRIFLLTQPTFCSTLGELIHPQLYPCIKYLDLIRITLLNSYISDETLGKTSDPKSYTQIYCDICGGLFNLINRVRALSNIITLGDGFHHAKPVKFVQSNRKRAPTGDRDSDGFELDEGDDAQVQDHPNKRPKTRQQTKLDAEAQRGEASEGVPRLHILR